MLNIKHHWMGSIKNVQFPHVHLAQMLGEKERQDAAANYRT